MQGCRSLPGTETWIGRPLTEFPSGADVTLGRRAHLCWDGQAAPQVVEGRGGGGVRKLSLQRPIPAWRRPGGGVDCEARLSLRGPGKPAASETP